MNRSKWMIVGIVGLSLLAVVASLVWRYLETRDVLEFWGPDAVELIARAEQVELMKLRPISETELPEPPLLMVDGWPHAIIEISDARKSPGFTNARHALTLSRSFQWDQQADAEPTWSLALQFSEGEKSVVVLIDPDRRLVRLKNNKRAAVIQPRIADGLATLFDEQFKRAAAREKTTADEEATTNQR
jgi:hypothetical protein